MFRNVYIHSFRQRNGVWDYWASYVYSRTQAQIHRKSEILILFKHLRG